MATTFSAVRDDALANLDAVGLIKALADGVVSQDEVTAAALARAELAREPLNAVFSSVHSPALGTGPFAGIPTFVKDNEDFAGQPTTYGSRATSRKPAVESSVFISQFEQLGFTVLGKSSMPEFGLTAVTEPLAFGPTRNPRNLAHSAGGSSGGAAALVAAGVVPIAHANDGGGSIRIPASCCGLVGMKPSRSRLASNPEMERLPIEITTQGVVTRSVRDTALFFSEIENIRCELPAIGHITGPGKERLRIAVVDEAMAGLPVGTDEQETVRSTAKVCEDLGHHIEVIAFPFSQQFGRDFLRYWAALAFTLKVGGKRMFDPAFDKTQLEPLTFGLSRLFGDVAVRMPATLRRLRNFRKDYEAAFANFDLMLTPVLAHPAPEVGYLAPDIDINTHLIRLLRWASFTAMHNVAGAPAISLPVGLSRNGLPIGVQIAAPFGHEARILELSYELEAAIGWK